MPTPTALATIAATPLAIHGLFRAKYAARRPTGPAAAPTSALTAPNVGLPSQRRPIPAASKRRARSTPRTLCHIGIPRVVSHGDVSHGQAYGNGYSAARVISKAGRRAFVTVDLTLGA